MRFFFFQPPKSQIKEKAVVQSGACHQVVDALIAQILTIHTPLRINGWNLKEFCPVKRTHSVTTYVHPGSMTSSVTFDIYECLMSFFHFVTIDDTPKTKRHIKPEKW